jgi:hypothetical protein
MDDQAHHITYRAFQGAVEGYVKYNLGNLLAAGLNPSDRVFNDALYHLFQAGFAAALNWVASDEAGEETPARPDEPRPILCTDPVLDRLFETEPRDWRNIELSPDSTDALCAIAMARELSNILAGMGDYLDARLLRGELEGDCVIKYLQRRKQPHS